MKSPFAHLRNYSPNFNSNETGSFSRLLLLMFEDRTAAPTSKGQFTLGVPQRNGALVSSCLKII